MFYVQLTLTLLTQTLPFSHSLNLDSVSSSLVIPPHSGLRAAQNSDSGHNYSFFEAFEYMILISLTNNYFGYKLTILSEEKFVMCGCHGRFLKICVFFYCFSLKIMKSSITSSNMKLIVLS